MGAPALRICTQKFLYALTSSPALHLLGDFMKKCSNLFNLLDARGAISVTERVGVIARVRKLAVGVAQAFQDQEQYREMHVLK